MKPEVSGELFWLACCKLRLVTGAATRGRFLAIGLVTESRGRVVGTELSVDVGVRVVSQHCFEFCCLELSFLIFWITFFFPVFSARMQQKQLCETSRHPERLRQDPAHRFNDKESKKGSPSLEQLGISLIFFLFTHGM